MSHHPQSMKVSRSDAPIPLPAQNNITRERAMHMIDQSQSYGRYTFLKAPLDEVYHVVKSRGLLYPSTPIAKLPNRWDNDQFCEFHGTMAIPQPNVGI